MIKSRQLVKLGDILQIASGGTPSRKNAAFFDDGEIPWFKTGDLKRRDLFESEEKITREALTNSSAKLFPPNTVLVAMYGATIGACGILRVEGSTNQACAAFLPNEKVLPEYLYYFIQINKQNFVKIGVGGAQPNISGEKLKNFKIALPSINDQERVVKIINKAESALAKRRQTIRLADEFLKSAFLEMFGDPINNPKKLSLMKLKDIAEIKSGGTPSRKFPEYFLGNIPWVTTVALNKTYIDTEDAVSHITKKAVEESATKIIPAYSILFGVRVGVGKLSINLCPMATSQDVIGIIPIEKNLVREYLLYALRSFTFIFSRNSRGATIQGITSDVVKNLRIPMPNQEKQQKFADIVQKVEKYKEKLKASETQLQNLFNSLMQRAFRGKLFND